MTPAQRDTAKAWDLYKRFQEVRLLAELTMPYFIDVSTDRPVS